MDLKEITKQLILGGYSNSERKSLQNDEAFQELLEIANPKNIGLTGKTVSIRYMNIGRYQYEGLRIDKDIKYNIVIGEVVNDTFKQIYIDSKEDGFHIIPYQCIIELHEIKENNK